MLYVTTTKIQMRGKFSFAWLGPYTFSEIATLKNETEGKVRSFTIQIMRQREDCWCWQ